MFHARIPIDRGCCYWHPQRVLLLAQHAAFAAGSQHDACAAGEQQAADSAGWGGVVIAERVSIGGATGGCLAGVVGWGLVMMQLLV